MKRIVVTAAADFSTRIRLCECDACATTYATAHAPIKPCAACPEMPTANARNSGRQWWRTRSASGVFFSFGAFSSTSWNTFDSDTLRRMKTAIIMNAADSTNGTRQPHERNCSSGSVAMPARMSVPTRVPVGAPMYENAAANPRERFFAFSNPTSVAPPHSPPTAMPCTTRRVTSSAGAHSPICAVAGSSPISVDVTPITTIVAIRTVLRPTLSPRCPKREWRTRRSARRTGPDS